MQASNLPFPLMPRNIYPRMSTEQYLTAPCVSHVDVAELEQAV